MTSIVSFQHIGPPRETALPRSVYRYVLTTSAVHQLALVVLTVVVALLEWHRSKCSGGLSMNRRTGARIRVLRQLGIAMIDRTDGADDERRIQQAFALDMGIFKIKFTMNFLMNLYNHLQIVSALIVGGWWVYTDHLEIGGVVAFISGIGRMNDLWGDLVNYFRDINVTQVEYPLLADAVDQLSAPITPVD